MTNVTIPVVPVKELWNEQKGKLKAKFPALTDEDLRLEEGKKEEMYKRISEKIGKTKEELAMIISKL